MTSKYGIVTAWRYNEATVRLSICVYGFLLLERFRGMCRVVPNMQRHSDFYGFFMEAGSEKIT
jgi:hypothetical protein